MKERRRGKLICAWCNKFMAWILDFEGVTHGCCDDCYRKVMNRNGPANQDATARLTSPSEK